MLVRLRSCAIYIYINKLCLIFFRSLVLNFLIYRMKHDLSLWCKKGQKIVACWVSWSFFLEYLKCLDEYVIFYFKKKFSWESDVLNIQNLKRYPRNSILQRVQKRIYKAPIKKIVNFFTIIWVELSECPHMAQFHFIQMN